MEGYDEISNDMEELVSKVMEVIEQTSNRTYYIEYDNDFIHINLLGEKNVSI